MLQTQPNNKNFVDCLKSQFKNYFVK